MHVCCVHALLVTTGGGFLWCAVTPIQLALAAEALPSLKAGQILAASSHTPPNGNVTLQVRNVSNTSQLPRQILAASSHTLPNGTVTL